MKDAFRKEILRRRSLFSLEEIKEKSLKIQKKLFVLPDFVQADNILFYMAKDKEVQTETMVKKALKMEKKIFLPSVDRKNKKLFFSRIEKIPEDLIKGAFDVWEPKYVSGEVLAEGEIDIIVLPGVAFDQKGGRIGYGGGYYDRLLSSGYEKTIKIGLAFENQIVKEVPQMSHDILMDIIVTEKRVFDCKKGRESKR